MSRDAGDKLEIAHYAGTWENLPSAYRPAGFRVFTIALLLCTALTAGTIESKGGLSISRLARFNSVLSQNAIVQTRAKALGR